MEKNKYLPLVLLLVTSLSTFPQSINLSKKPIDTSVFNKWPNIKSFEARISNDGKYVVYTIDRQPANSSTMVVKAVNGRWERRYVGATKASFSNDAKRLSFQISDSLYNLRLGGETRTPISLKLSRFTEHTVNGIDTSLIYQALGKPGQIIDTGLTLNIATDILYGKDRTQIFFFLIEKYSPKAQISTGATGVNVWNYKDEQLQPEQFYKLKHPNLYEHNFLAVMDSKTGKIVQLTRNGEMAVNFHDNTNYLLLLKIPGVEGWWRKEQQGYITLVSLKDGSRSITKYFSRRQDTQFDLSPFENYLVYFDPSNQSYYSYEPAKGTERLLTFGKEIDWGHYIEYPDPYLAQVRQPYGFAGWLDGDKKVLVYDNHDIWALDPSGKTKPECVTRSFGRLHHMKLTIVNRASGSLISGGYDRTLISGEKLILKGVNEYTEEVGLYSFVINGSKDPKVIINGNYDEKTLAFVAKAKNKNTWLLNVSGVDDAPNLFVVDKEKVKTRLTNLQPQRAYNWYTTELVNWKLPNGKVCQGVLYRPENLDTTRKYPLIFNYYQTHPYSHNAWLEPQWMYSENLNIPFFTSRGYLVFYPDIHYEIGHPMESALNTVVSAAEYLTRKPYVDKTKMGLIGHSFGGFETNYIITHSNFFAAAITGAGGSDWISNYNSILDPGPGTSTQWLFEIFQNRLGATLWEKPQLYIENSPIFNLDKVTTPLLIGHNRLDESVPWQQAVELFTGLRRLRKKVWMLEYDGQGHDVTDADLITNQRDTKDLTVRMTQFFDYYLKAAPPPIWMTEGVSAKDKGIKTGLELDSSGKQP